MCKKHNNFFNYKNVFINLLCNTNKNENSLIFKNYSSYRKKIRYFEA